MTASRRPIRGTAIALLEQLGVKEPPIPVERLARHLGAQLKYEPFDGELSGLLYRELDQVIIGVNSLHSTNRQRFTIAHEIGHFVLHDKASLHVDRNFRVHLRDVVSSQGVDRSEIAANTFAAELLMPSHMLRTDLDGHVLDVEDDDMLKQLAARYGVSLQAMIFRLTNLGMINQDFEISS